LNFANLEFMVLDLQKNQLYLQEPAMSFHEPNESCACGGSCGCRGEQTETVELTKDAYILRLEAYLGDLKAEIISVERELSQLRQIT
jgi:hypothetical protein